MMVPSRGNKKRWVYSGAYRGQKAALEKAMLEYPQLKNLSGSMALPEHVSAKVVLYFYDRWLIKKGTLRKKDISNYIKAVEDVVFKHIGLDDSIIISNTQEKELEDDPNKKRIEIDIELHEY